ncbi:carbohydrate-binding module family 50 protein [Biscogniauxia sp. FL1348]|nr:carbohydrate-binding module family 50 protein [Biscogniauxia sp. FL1348]
MVVNMSTYSLGQRGSNSWYTWIVNIAILTQLASAVQLYTNTSIPTTLSPGCQTAFLAEVAECNLTVTKFRYGYFYPESTLQGACTTNCGSALQSFESSIFSACGNDTWEGYDGEGLPAALIPNVLRYLYELTCLQDSGRFCNVVAGSSAAIADPGDGVSGWLGAVENGTAPADSCDLCLVKSLRMQAGSPYYDGPAIARSSLYESKTSSCSINDMPRTTSALPTSLPPFVEPSPIPCAGKTYQIQPGDDCHSVSNSQGIGTAWLLADNNLASFCSDFPTSGALCLINTCSVYTVKTNDTCKGIAKSANITQSQLMTWNPIISSGCYNLERLVGDQVCISMPGIAYVDPAPTVIAPTTATTAAPVPTDVAPGVNMNCGRYYQVQPDEYCNMIVLRFGISLADFRLLNPDINDNCTNLFAYESYCVMPVGDISSYSSRSGAITTPTTTIPFTSILSLDPVTDSAPIVTSTSLPVAAGTREDCSRYFDGAQMLSENISTTSYANACEFAAAVWAVSLDDLMLWNPDLGNLTNGECDMNSDVRYCAKLLFADPPPEAVGPDYGFDIRNGSIESCTQYADAYPDWECTDILLNYELTIAQFYEYNPEVGEDCSGLWPSYAYCIRAPDYTPPGTPSSTTTAPPGSSTTTSSGPPAPTPTQDGNAVSNCNAYAQAQEGDWCAAFAERNGVREVDLYAWNSVLGANGENCASSLWYGYWYCIGVS